MRYSILLLFLFVSMGQSIAGGIEFFHGTWEEALEESKTQDKPIFVDAFTTWCGPCKRMAATVFTAETVGEFYNANFICMKIDMEKPEGKKFQQKYPVSAYPTLYYIDGDGETIYHTKGGRQVEQFIELGRTVLGKTDKSGEFAEKYDAGDRNPELVYNYVKALNKAGKPSLKIANDYLDSQDDLSSDFNLKFIYESTVEADSRIFDLLIQHRSAIEAKESKEAVNQKIKDACKETAKKALEFQIESLHDEAKAKMKAHCPEYANVFSDQVDMNYYRATKDAKNYVKVCNNYAKKTVKDNAKELHNLSKDLKGSFAEDKSAMKLAEKLAKKATEHGEAYEYYYTYAEVLLMNGKKSEALSMANKSLELASGQKNVEQGIQSLIEKIEKS
jgi:thiol-disulfide isomerase/thioredoxin